MIYSWPLGRRSNEDEIMPDFDRETLKHSLQSQLRSRVAASRHMQPEFASAKQMRRDSIRNVETALAQMGIDPRKLRVALARSREERQEAATALRTRILRPAPSEPEAAIVPSRRFQSLRALAGRATPFDLGSTSLTFLNEPVDFISSESSYNGATFLKSFSLAADNTYFRTNVAGEFDTDNAGYGFVYVWNNDSDSEMFATVSTAVDINGALVSFADMGGEDVCWEGVVNTYMNFGFNLGITPNLDIESRDYGNLIDCQAIGGRFGIGSDFETLSFDYQAYGFNIDSFLVPQRAALVITVWANFWFWFGFDDTHHGALGSNFGEADFADKDYRISCPGVVILASPVLAGG
jgi:hypothetical protein